MSVNSKLFVELLPEYIIYMTKMKYYSYKFNSASLSDALSRCIEILNGIDDIRHVLHQFVLLQRRRVYFVGDQPTYSYVPVGTLKDLL